VVHDSDRLHGGSRVAAKRPVRVEVIGDEDEAGFEEVFVARTVFAKQCDAVRDGHGGSARGEVSLGTVDELDAKFSVPVSPAHLAHVELERFAHEGHVVGPNVDDAQAERRQLFHGIAEEDHPVIVKVVLHEWGGFPFATSLAHEHPLAQHKALDGTQ
jgi:hypothetical protein